MCVIYHQKTRCKQLQFVNNTQTKMWLLHCFANNSINLMDANNLDYYAVFLVDYWFFVLTFKE
ncbi:hypothetical protein BZG77_10415 [Salinivibrio sp. IB643]|nr:hypothetical protein BZG77_10415 [Salinivibrio sp. IB643]